MKRIKLTKKHREFFFYLKEPVGVESISLLSTGSVFECEKIVNVFDGVYKCLIKEPKCDECNDYCLIMVNGKKMFGFIIEYNLFDISSMIKDIYEIEVGNFEVRDNILYIYDMNNNVKFKYALFDASGKLNGKEPVKRIRI